MKTSQLIDRLQLAIKEYGDLDVYITEFTREPRRLFNVSSHTNGSQDDYLKLVHITVVLT